MSQTQENADKLLSYLPETGNGPEPGNGIGKTLVLPLSLHDSISELRQRASGKILEISTDALSGEVDSGSGGDGDFDYIISVGALAVCRDFDGFVGQVKQLLAPGGQLLFCEPEAVTAARRGRGGGVVERRGGRGGDINPDITLRLWRNDMTVLWVNRHTAPNTASPTARFWNLKPKTHWHRYFCGAANCG